MAAQTTTPDAHQAALELDEALRSGGWLNPRCVDDAPLMEGEVAYADLAASGWRHFGLDHVEYEHRTLVAGGPILMLLTGIASVIGNRRARRAAQIVAQPQWRPLGPIRVVVTSDRLLMQQQGAWWSVWYSSITAVECCSKGPSMDIHLRSEPPWRLTGPSAPAAAVAMRHIAAAATVRAPGT